MYAQLQQFKPIAAAFVTAIAMVVVSQVTPAVAQSDPASQDCTVFLPRLNQLERLAADPQRYSERFARVTHGIDEAWNGTDDEFSEEARKLEPGPGWQAKYNSLYERIRRERDAALDTADIERERIYAAR